LFTHADGAEEYDSEGSDSDEDEEYGEGPNGMYEEDSDNEDDSDDSDEADDGFVHRSSVIIEEVNDGEHDVAQVTTTTSAKVRWSVHEQVVCVSHSCLSWDVLQTNIVASTRQEGENAIANMSCGCNRKALL